MPSPNTLVNEVITAIRNVVGSSQVALHEPSFEGNEWIYLKECLESSYVSSVGKFVDQFEDDLANYTGSKYAISVVNGTAALQIALKLAGVQPNDEVLIPALTFVATANAVAYCNAIPHFVDSEERTLGIDSLKLRKYLEDNSSQHSGTCVNNLTGRVIRALVPMHTFGHPSDIEGLLSIARDFNLVLVEDAAESLGSYYNGAILTNSESLARHAKHLTTTAKLPHPWEFRHDEIGYNYRMPNINAALGCAQLEQLPAKLAAKRELFSRYHAAFASIKGVTLFNEPQNCQSNYWLQVLLLDENISENRNQILESTNKVGIMTRPVWVLLNELTPFRDLPSMDLSGARSLAGRIINIPSSPGLGLVSS